MQSNFAMNGQSGAGDARPRKRGSADAHGSQFELSQSARGAANWRPAVKPKSLDIRNPFNAMAVPEPSDREVMEFAARTVLAGATDDDNAKPWGAVSAPSGTIEGSWSSRWNGGADPTIPVDAADKWKQG